MKINEKAEQVSDCEQKQTFFQMHKCRRQVLDNLYKSWLSDEGRMKTCYFMENL